jgi:hypothetical protein
LKVKTEWKVREERESKAGTVEQMAPLDLRGVVVVVVVVIEEADIVVMRRVV